MTCSYETERIAEDRDWLAHNPEVASAEYACPWIEEPRERRSTARRRVDVRVPPCTVGHALHRQRSGKVAYGAQARSCPGLAGCNGDRPGRAIGAPVHVNVFQHGVAKMRESRCV